MKRFKDFINETKEEYITFENFLEDVMDALKHDFKNTKEQSEIFINQYKDILKDSWENGYTVREAIASTKIPGVKVSSDAIEESFIFDIDDDYENSIRIIENLNLNNLVEGTNCIDNYYHKYYKKTFSDMRIFERVKNNYKSLKNIYNEKTNNLL